MNGGTDNYQGKTIYLADNIDLSNETWTTPIGTDGSKSFCGTFDGGGHLISNLSVDNGNNGYTGLFGYVYNGTVRNLRVSGTVTTTGYYAGGIVGYLDGSTVENCIFGGTVSGKKRVGGIAGYSPGTSRIAGCHTKGRVTATESQSGGIAGDNYGSSITNCYSEAVVEAKSDMAGGIVGDNYGTITNCYATGAISSGKQAGGIVGNNYGTTVTNCFALNLGITRTSGNETTFGRVVGNDAGGSSVTSCFAFKDMTIKDDSNNTDIIGGATSVAGTDLTAANCLTKTTYTDREFTTANGWAFDTATPWAYLPWNPAFENFSNIQPGDYRISVPPHLNGNGGVN